MVDLGQAKTPNRRLDSWKEIAAFFSRDERTVKRWEKERGLPVHRLQDGARGPVHAFTDELVRWMKSPASTEPAASTTEPLEADGASPAGETSQGITPPQAAVAQDGIHLRRRASDKPHARRRGLLLGALAGGAALIVAAGFLYVKWAPSRSARANVPARPPLTEVRTTNPEAREFYLKGRYEWDKRTPESLTKAVDYFTQAIVHDPNYAPAYVGLADSYNLLREYSAMPSAEAYSRASAAARKAVELDDSSADAHTSLAFATFYGSFDRPVAEREFRRALSLSPNDARSHHWYGTFLLADGKYPEALSEIEIAQQLDPASTAIIADKGLILLYAGPREQGVALLKQLESTDPGFPLTYRYLQTASLLNKDYRTYLEEAQKEARLSHDRQKLAIVEAGEKGFSHGEPQAMFEGMLAVQEKLYAEQHLPAYELAEAYAYAGNKPEALSYLQIAYQHHEAELAAIRNSPAFEELHSEPSFRNLVVQVGLSPLQ
jgi:Tfp pilus assembly protein PilF